MEWTKIKPISRAASVKALKEYAQSGLYAEVVNLHLPWILESCYAYIELFQSPAALLAPSHLSHDDRKILSNLYDYKAFDDIDQFRKASKSYMCPYCGLQNSVTLDHYLPQRVQDFPHLSFFSLNLVPACGDCQGAKGTFWPKGVLGSTFELIRKKRRVTFRRRKHTTSSRTRRGKIRNTARLLHPYLDSQIDLWRLELSFDFDADSGPFNFRLSYTGGRRAPEARLVRFHLEKLRVESRIFDPLRLEWNALGLYLNRLFPDYLNKDQIRSAVAALASNDLAKYGGASLTHKFLFAVAKHELAVQTLWHQWAQIKKGWFENRVKARPQ